MQPKLHTADERATDQYDHENDRYAFQYDTDGTATLTATIVHALAMVADIDVTQGEFSLYDSIDPEALELLFAKKADGSERAGGHVAFTALEYEVYVYSDGAVYIYPPSSSSSPAPSATDERGPI